MSAATDQLIRYTPSTAAIATLAQDYMQLTVSGIDDRAGLVAVHDARIHIKKLRVDVEKKRICWDLLYRTAPFCDVAWIRLKGPVNEDDALEPANILANFSGPSSPDVLIINGTEEHSACAHISSANLRTLLRNPAFHYVQMKTIGEEGPHEGCSTANVRDYVTGLCHHQDFELDMIDDDDSQNDDDDSHHHHHHHEHGSDSSDHDDDDEPTILHAKHGLHASAQFRKAHNGARGRH